MLENHSDCSRMAQHDRVLGPSGHVKPNPIVCAQPVQYFHSTLQSDPSQESVKVESSCLAPGAPAIKEQGFYEAVASQIEALQRVSTRSVYEAKWTLFTKSCHSNQVDFRTPPIKSIDELLLYLFQDRKLQPSILDG